MKGKKILSAIIVGAMVLCTMSFPAFADNSTGVEYNGRMYTSFTEAQNAVQPDATEITYTIHGKVVLPNGYITNLTGAASNAEIVNFKGADRDDTAELALVGTGANIIGLDMTGSVKTVNYEKLILSRANGGWIGDIGHANNYFTTAMRGAADGVVNYISCTFPNGSCNNFYSKTVYTDCKFNNDTEYGLWIYGGETEVTGATFTGAKGVQAYSEDVNADVTTKITDSTFDGITKKPAIISGTKGTVTLENITTTNCKYGLLQTKPKDGNASLPCASVTIDGEEPAYIAKVGSSLYTDQSFAEKEAGEKGTTVAPVVAKVNGQFYSSLADAVAAAQAATTDKWSIAKITLLTNDALDISKGPDKYVSYNITKNDTVVTGERIANDAHKDYYKLTNASTLYIPADVNSLILENVKNLCRIEIAKGADVTLKLKGDNELAGNIFVPEGAKLTIEDITADGTGRLAVYNTADKKYLPGMNAFGAGDGYSAAIGGSMTQPGGEIVIKSGKIEAYSNYGAAIGGGQQQTAKVTILGGKIKAEASYGTAIGGGQQSTGDVTISGGVIDAKSDRSAPIGGGNQATADSNIIISGGDITVARDFGTNLFGNSTGGSAGAKISGGTFNTNVSDYCTAGFSPKLVNGVYVVNDLTTEIAVKFVPTRYKNVYDIVLDGNREKIYELVSAEIQFVNESKTLSNAAMSYEISGTDDFNVIPNTENADRYGFYLKDGAVGNRKTGTEIKIGTVTFPEQGAINFKVDAEGSKVVATEYATHLEKYYTAADANAKLTADSNGINSTIAAKTRDVAINVDFAHKLDNTGWNGNHQITVTLKDAFGNIVGDNAHPLAIANNAGTYTFANVPVGRITVTLKAPGFRTYTYTTTVEEGTAPLVLNFWNDTKRDTTAEVEAGKAMKNNFVVGDIAMDYTVDKYDLAAVTSYYGTYDLTDTNKIKYDLNRDGNIDITDVAYVLHNFGF